MDNKEIIKRAINIHFPNLRKCIKQELLSPEHNSTRFKFENTLINMTREDEKIKLNPQKLAKVVGGGRTLSFDGDEAIMSPDFIGDKEKRWKVGESKVKLIKPFTEEDLGLCEICKTMKHLCVCSPCYSESNSKNSETKPIIVGIVGNRLNWSYNQVKTKLLELNIDKCDMIVSGGATGVDTYAQMFAKEFGKELMIFYPNPRGDIPKRYFERNKLIADFCTYLVAFNYDSIKKSGTMNIVNQTKKLGKKVIIIRG